MEAVQEITQWATNTANHCYLLDGNRLVAYIKQGTDQPYYFTQPIMGFDRRGRKFKTVTPNPFDLPPQSPNTVTVQGSGGRVYTVNTEQASCTCPGYQFRGHCRHIKELAL